MSKRGAVYWAGRTWVSQFNLLDGTRPSIVLDFVNQKYFDGTNSNASLTSLVSGSPTIDANGMLCNATTFSGIGALLSAFQVPAVTLRVETSGGNGSANPGIVGMQNPYVPLFVNVNDTTTYNNTDLHCLPGLNWTGRNYHAVAWNASGRSVCSNATNAASDSGTMPAATAVTLGSFWAANIFGGYLRNLATWPVRAAAAVVQRISWPVPFLAPLIGSHCLTFLADSLGTASYITPGPKLVYERTQAWTCMAGVNVMNRPATAAVVFTNVVSSPWYGYELWIDNLGRLRVRLMSNWTSGSGLCGIIGSINVADGKWHSVAATYDGSSLVAGIKLYVDGMLDAAPTVEQNDLSSTIVNGTPDFWIGNQFGGGFQVGALDNFVMSNVVRSGAYIAANVGVMPTVDANTQLSYAFEEGAGTTSADGSANNFTGTLKNGTAWV